MSITTLKLVLYVFRYFHQCLLKVTRSIQCNILSLMSVRSGICMWEAANHTVWMHITKHLSIPALGLPFCGSDVQRLQCVGSPPIPTMDEGWQHGTSILCKVFHLPDRCFCIKLVCAAGLSFIFLPKIWLSLNGQSCLKNIWLLYLDFWPLLKAILWALMIVQNDRVRDNSGTQKCLPVVSGFEQPLVFGNDIVNNG